MREKLTIVIPTWENDLEIAKGAINSVLWADEIILIDSSCSSKVKKIASKWGLVYYGRKMKYWAEQKNWVIPKARNNWVMVLDSDEIVTDKLKNTIQNLLKSDSLNNFDGYGIARKHFFLGKFLRWGGRYPLYNVRLFKKSCRYEQRDVHEHIVLKKNQIKNINAKNGDLLHFSDRSFSQFFQRFDRYSTHQANYMVKLINKKNGSEIDWAEFFVNFYYFKSVVKDFWFFIPGTSLARFIWMYVFRLGFLDGKYGFLIALLYAFQDYVSKLKFQEIYKGETRFSFRVSNYIMRKFVPILMDNKKMTENYILSYDNCFNIVK